MMLRSVLLSLIFTFCVNTITAQREQSLPGGPVQNEGQNVKKPKKKGGFLRGLGNILVGAAVETIEQKIAPSNQTSNPPSTSINWTTPVTNWSTPVKEPFKTVAEPFKTVAEPFKTVSDPFKTVVEPFKTVSDPFKTVENWSTPVSDPFKTVVEPFKTVAEPFKTVADPFKTVADPFKTVADPFKPVELSKPVELTNRSVELSNPVQISNAASSTSNTNGSYAIFQNSQTNLNGAIDITRKIAEGRWLGTGYVLDAQNWYQQQYNQSVINGKPNNWYLAGIGITSLWTPDNYQTTLGAFTLVESVPKLYNLLSTSGNITNWTINQTSNAVLKNGFYEVNGFKFSSRYYNYLWNTGRGAPSLVAKEILAGGAKYAVPDAFKTGFYKYIYGGWEMVYNPITKEVYHLLPIGK